MKSGSEPLKAYFSAPGTIATWWRSEAWSDVLNEYFEEQVRYVRTAADWKGKRVLDAGTGFGRFAGALASSGARVRGLDLSEDMLAMARSNEALSGYDIAWGRGDVESLPFANNSFDAATCMETLMHVPDPAAAVKELGRVVRPGGIVVLSINNRKSLPYLVEGAQLHLRLYRWIRNRVTPYHSNTIPELRRWLEEADLEIVDEAGVGLIHPAVYARILPGVSWKVVPDRLSKWMLAVEKQRGWQRTWLRRYMKAFVVTAVRRAAAPVGAR